MIRIQDHCRKHGKDPLRAVAQGTMARFFWPRDLKKVPA